MRTLAIFTVILLSGCASMRPFYPIAGSIGGAAIGATVGGIPGAAAGAGIGAAVGEIGHANGKLADAQEEIKLLTTGDVDGLVKKRMEEAKEGGFFDSILDEVYGLVKLVVIGVALLLVVPILYTMFVHKKIKGRNGTDI